MDATAGGTHLKNVSVIPREPPTVVCLRCHTRFRVREDQLAVAGGQVRCGTCLALFEAAPANTSEREPSVGDDPEEPSPDAPLSDGERGRRVALLSAGVVVAALALVFQLFVYQFDRWALEPDVRSIYEFACRVIGCELPRRKA